MRKLTLDLDQLRVESFDTQPGAPEKRGTVRGHQELYFCGCCCCCPCCCDTGFTACGQYTCALSCNGTCNASCNGTCDASCNGTCNASCNGTCDASCNRTCGEYTCGYSCDYTCRGCSMEYGTCDGYGTCGQYPCRAIP